MRLFNIEVYDFASVKANAGRGGNDVAQLYDSPGDDLFVGKADYGALFGDGFNNEAYGFDGVHAYATAGGIDLAKMFDSPGDDTFYADPVRGRCTARRILQSGQVLRGRPRLCHRRRPRRGRLFGTTDSDIFVGMPDESALYGTGYYNRAKYFDEVFADVGADAYQRFDKVKLHDTAGDDTFSLSRLRRRSADRREAPLSRHGDWLAGHPPADQRSRQRRGHAHRRRRTYRHRVQPRPDALGVSVDGGASVARSTYAQSRNVAQGDNRFAMSHQGFSRPRPTLGCWNVDQD